MSVPDRESKKQKSKYEPQITDGKNDVTFFAPGFTMHSFYIPAKDENGKNIPARNKDNTVKYLNGEPLFIEVLCKFEVVSHGTKRNPENTLCIYQLKADDPRYEDKLAILQSFCADMSQPVMDQKQYDEHTNRVGAKFKYENITLQKQNSDLKNTVAQMEAKIKELTEKK